MVEPREPLLTGGDGERLRGWTSCHATSPPPPPKFRGYFVKVHLEGRVDEKVFLFESLSEGALEMSFSITSLVLRNRSRRGGSNVYPSS